MKIENGIGIVDANGHGFLSYADRFKLYKTCGFDSVMIWWGKDASSTREARVQLARDHNLHIADVHSDFNNINSIWVAGEAGQSKFLDIIEEVEDCHKYGIDTMVMHVSKGDHPPEISELGLERLETIFKLALEYDINIALENTRQYEILKFILDKHTDSNIGFCYDSGHENLWTKDVDWLHMYGDRLMAIHLHNNFGESDEHLKLSCGDIVIDTLVEKFLKTSYKGSLNFESVYQGENDIVKLSSYLKEVYQEGLGLLELLL